jgi:shikimate dehydrogenase
VTLDLLPPQPYRFGLLGWPLGHSLSPQIHAAALAASGLSGTYQLFPIPPLPDGAGLLQGIIERFRRLDLHGLNVTIPHKQAILPLLDGLTDQATAIGAVNLVYLQGQRLLGDNSDAPALLLDLQRCFSLQDQAGTALVLGAGGAARAAVYALLQAGWRVYVAARRVEAAQRLVVDLAPPASAGGMDLLASLSLRADALAKLPVCDLLINATPVGMHPLADSIPWPDGVPFPTGAKIYDMVYNPAQTTLVRAARAAGHLAANGLGMLVEQAALSFERWTGSYASRPAMWAAATGSLDTIG